MAYLVIVLIKKISTIDEPYTKLELTRAQYLAKPRYAKQMFTSLLFCPKATFFCQKVVKKKGVKMTCFVIRNFFSQYILNF
jgi:hypothetical protein